MTADQLETVVARTGHRRYRWLTSDDNPDERRREGYRALVARLAEGREPEPASPAPDSTIPWKVARRAQLAGYARCPYADAPSCGCVPPHCWRLGREVQIADCVDCLGIG